MACVEPVIILARLVVHETDVANLHTYYRKLRPALEKVEGFQGLSLWRNYDNGERFLAMYRYRDLACAEVGLQALTENRLLAQTAVASAEPADVIRGFVLGEDGRAPNDVRTGQYLSLSIRVAEPGYGQDLANELERIFGELTLIPGYLGSLYARNETLAEEIVGIVTWESPQAFASSVPPGTLYELMLYRKEL